MPTNLYGPNDNFDPETSHVLPALIRKFHEAKQSGASHVEIWGTGTPKREFLHVDDMAEGCIHVMTLPDTVVEQHLTNYPSPGFVNIGTGKDCSIKDLAELIRAETGFEGDLIFNASKPDGTRQKLMDVSRMKSIGWEAKISLKTGIKATYHWFVQNHR
jgi:GDP-L-fucose synthase